MTSTRTVLRALLATAALVSLAACLGDPTGQNTQATDYAIIDGTVTQTGSSQPVLNAVVGVHLPSNRNPAAYYAPAANSDDAGAFEIGIFRMDSTAIRGTPDTMTVWVIGTLPGVPTRNATDSVQTTVTFAPVNTTASASNVTLSLSSN